MLELTSLCETIPANKLLTAYADPKVKKTILTPIGPSWNCNTQSDTRIICMQLHTFS